MIEKTFGSLDRVQYHFRLWAPLELETYAPGAGWTVDPLKLLNPWRWLRVAFQRDSYHFEYDYRRGSSFRCYCPCGSNMTVRLVFLGWGLIVFRSVYAGKLPCVCDTGFTEYFRANDCEIEGT
jgi:hypothetical protein